MFSGEPVQYVHKVRYVRVPKSPGGVQRARRGRRLGPHGGSALQFPSFFSIPIGHIGLLDEARKDKALRGPVPFDAIGLHWTDAACARPVGVMVLRQSGAGSRAQGAGRAAPALRFPRHVVRSATPRQPIAARAVGELPAECIGRPGHRAAGAVGALDSPYPPQQGGNAHRAKRSAIPQSTLNSIGRRLEAPPRGPCGPIEGRQAHAGRAPEAAPGAAPSAGCASAQGRGLRFVQDRAPRPRGYGVGRGPKAAPGVSFTGARKNIAAAFPVNLRFPKIKE